MKKILSISFLSFISTLIFYTLSFSQEGGKQTEPPLTLIPHTYEKGEITRLCNEAMEALMFKLIKVASLDDKTRTFQNTVEEIEHATAEFKQTVSPLVFMAYVSTNKDLRDEGFQCEEKTEQTGIETSLRKDLYKAFEAFRENMKGDYASLSLPQRRLVEITDRDYRKSGLWLPDEKLNRLRELKKELASLETQFSKNLVEDKSSIAVTKEELSGTSEMFQQRLPKIDGLYIVKTTPADYFQFMQTADNSAARKRLYTAYSNRASSEEADNPGLLKKALKLRNQIATLLGYKTWADYRMDGRMAKTSDTVNTFLISLKEKLATRNKEEFSELLKLKQADDSSATDIDLWDRRYYETKLKRQKYTVNEEEVRTYFPSHRVISGTFEIYSKLLGLEFKEVKNTDLWQENVKLFEIKDKASQALIGYFFADLYPREGKYQHAAAFTLRDGRALQDGSYQTTISAIVANVNPPSEKVPSLMNHQEVETFFHEFGHIMHQTLTRAPYASFSGTSVARDFVEAPSQMFENWIWNENMLSLISGHYQDETKKLPTELLQKLLNLSKVNQAIFYTRQIYLALLDLTLHTSGDDVDPVMVDHKLRLEIMGRPYPIYTHWVAGFGHLMGGYDSGYYGYLWSEVYAEDMFTKFLEAGLLNEDIGMKYRKTILEQGSSKNESELLKDFLGREPNADAFYKKLGLSPRSH